MLHNKSQKQTKMKTGQKLQYIGKGFIGFHPSYTEMTFIEKDGNDLKVYYKGGAIQGKMLVKPNEVKTL